jgi:hypothetical protein
MNDAQGAIDPRAMHDAAGPVRPRSLFDNVLSSFSRSFFHKESSQPASTEAESSINEVIPSTKTAAPATRDDALNLQRRSNSMAERMAKVRSEQLKTMSDLDSLEKNTAEQIKRMEEKK